MKNTSSFKLINCAKYAVSDKKRKKSKQQNEFSHICIFENKACLKMQNTFVINPKLKCIETAS